MEISKQLILLKKIKSVSSSGSNIAAFFECQSKRDVNKEYKQLFLSISEEVKKGNSLWYSIKKQGKIFDSFYLEVIKVGESSGKLDSSLEELIQYIENDLKVRKQFFETMRAPFAVALVFSLIFAIFFLYVIPTAGSYISEIASSLESVEFIISLLQKIIVAIFFNLFAISAIAFFSFVNVEPLNKFISPVKYLKSFFDELVLYLPVIGKLSKQKDLYSYLFAIKISYNAGISIVESTESAVNLVANQHIKEILSEVPAGLNNGNSLYSELSDTGLFSEEIIDYITIGEKTGKLDEFIYNSIQTTKEEIDKTLQLLLLLLKPMGTTFSFVFILCIFAIIGSIIYSVISNIKGVL